MVTSRELCRLAPKRFPTAKELTQNSKRQSGLEMWLLRLSSCNSLPKPPALGGPDNVLRCPGPAQAGQEVPRRRVGLVCPYPVVRPPCGAPYVTFQEEAGPQGARTTAPPRQRGKKPGHKGPGLQLPRVSGTRGPKTAGQPPVADATRTTCGCPGHPSESLLSSVARTTAPGTCPPRPTGEGRRLHVHLGQFAMAEFERTFESCGQLQVVRHDDEHDVPFGGEFGKKRRDGVGDLLV